MKSAAKSVPAALLVLVLAIGASASPRTSQSLQLWSGYMMTGGDRFIMITDQHAIVTEIKDGALVGLKYGLAVGTYFETEVALGGSAGGFRARLIDTTLPAGDDSNVYADESTNPLGYVQLNINLYALNYCVSPFVTGGLGWVVLIDDRSSAWNYGAGVKLQLSGRIAVKVAARRFKTDLHTAVEFFSTVGWDPDNWGWVRVPYEDRLEFTEIGASLSWAFFIR